jgi:glycosyltransferase involved in cell wall biosynthesis
MSRAIANDLSLLRVHLVHPTGNDNVRQALLALSGAGALDGFHTTIAWNAGSALTRVLPAGVREELERRGYPGIPAEMIHTHPWREGFRLLAGRMGWRELARHEKGPLRLDAVCAALDRAAGRAIDRGTTRLDAVYAYEDCALESLQAGRMRGARRFYELPIGYARAWVKLRALELEREPLWGQTIDAGAFTEARMARKDLEIAAADRVIVPSRFVAGTLVGCPARDVVVVPYGCPEPAPLTSKPRAGGPLRVLFVGHISQRKGISYLLRAMELLGGAAYLTIVGQFTHHSAELAAQLKRHNCLGTMPRDRVLDQMRSHDVLVLPTLFEGRALVVLEALAQGLPVVTTANSGCTDVVVDGASGFIVPVSSAEAIAGALMRLGEDRGLLETMREGALRMAVECSWEKYRERLLEAVLGGLDTA